MADTKTPLESLTVQVSAETRARLEAQAAREQRSVASLVRFIIDRFFRDTADAEA